MTAETAAHPITDDLDRPIFQSDQRGYTLKEVVSAAQFRGDAQDVLAGIRDALACERYGEEQSFALEQDELQAAVDAYRYDRRIITAEETETWLRERDLKLEDLVQYLERQLWRERLGPQLPMIRDRYTPSQAEVRSILWPELILRGRLGLLALPLAWRVAASAAAGGTDLLAETLEEARADFFRREGCGPDHLHAWLEQWSCSLEWFEELIRMEAHYVGARRGMLTAENCAAVLRARRLPLLRVAAEVAPFPSMSMAHEALLCVTHDGETLQAVVERAGASVTRSTAFMEDIPEPLGQRLLSAASGEFLPPMQGEEGFVVYRLLEKLEPDLRDPEVRARVETLLLNEAFGALMGEHIQWISPLE